MKDNTYTLVVPIQFGSDTVETIELHKPTLGELTKVRSTEPYTRGLEMLVACSNQPKIVLQQLSYDDTSELVERVLPDFLGIENDPTED